MQNKPLYYVRMTSLFSERGDLWGKRKQEPSAGDERNQATFDLFWWGVGGGGGDKN